MSDAKDEVIDPTAEVEALGKLKAEATRENNANNPATEEDAIPDYSTTINDLNNSDDVAKKPTIQSKETQNNTIDIRLLQLETQIKELRKQLAAIGRHSNKIDRKYLKEIRKILKDAKKEQIDVNQWYSDYIERKDFDDIRSIEDVSSMLLEIENKIAFARQAGSKVLTGQ